jgi:hypothetical protein
LCRALVRLGVELVAIERPDGLLVERLLDAGLRILPLHPNEVAATRDRFRASGGKSGRRLVVEISVHWSPLSPAAAAGTEGRRFALGMC